MKSILVLIYTILVITIGGLVGYHLKTDVHKIIVKVPKSWTIFTMHPIVNKDRKCYIKMLGKDVGVQICQNPKRKIFFHRYMKVCHVHFKNPRHMHKGIIGKDGKCHIKMMGKKVGRKVFST